MFSIIIVQWNLVKVNSRGLPQFVLRANVISQHTYIARNDVVVHVRAIVLFVLCVYIPEWRVGVEGDFWTLVLQVLEPHHSVKLKVTSSFLLYLYLWLVCYKQ